MNFPTPSSSIVGGIASRLREAVGHSIHGSAQVSVLYSGGLDSSLVACVARDLARVELVTVGVRGSSDLSAAESGSHVLDLPWAPRIIDLTDIQRVLLAGHASLANASRASRAVLVGTVLGAEAANCPVVLCGQGADELFLGYAHFDGLSPEDTSKRRQEDLDRLLGDDWPRAVELSRSHSKELRAPFLAPEFLINAREIAIERLRAGAGRKPLLRAVAMEMGVPEELIARPKKAFQYGSGIERLMKSLRTAG
jgi:asparagine synthase (glutamine-hydrolysing)